MRMISRRKIGWSIVGTKTKYYFNKPEYFNFNNQISKHQRFINGLEYGKNYELAKVKHLIDLSRHQKYTLYITVLEKDISKGYYDGTEYESIEDAISSLLRQGYKEMDDPMDFYKKYDDCEIIAMIEPYTFECHPDNHDLYIKLCSRGWIRKKYKKKDRRTKSNKYYIYFN